LPRKSARPTRRVLPLLCGDGAGMGQYFQRLQRAFHYAGSSRERPLWPPSPAFLFLLPTIKQDKRRPGRLMTNSFAVHKSFQSGVIGRGPGMRSGLFGQQVCSSAPRSTPAAMCVPSSQRTGSALGRFKRNDAPELSQFPACSDRSRARQLKSPHHPTPLPPPADGKLTFRQACQSGSSRQGNKTTRERPAQINVQLQAPECPADVAEAFGSICARPCSYAMGAKGDDCPLVTVDMSPVQLRAVRRHLGQWAG